jgi:hypothetical protein
MKVKFGTDGYLQIWINGLQKWTFQKCWKDSQRLCGKHCPNFKVVCGPSMDETKIITCHNTIDADY